MAATHARQARPRKAALKTSTISQGAASSLLAALDPIHGVGVLEILPHAKGSRKPVVLVKRWSNVREAISSANPKYIVVAASAFEPGEMQIIDNLAVRAEKARSADAPRPSTSLGRMSQEERWHALQEQFLRDWDCVTAPELARVTGSRAGNPSARAYAWRKAGRIFSVNDGTAERFPLFQIKDRQPRPILTDVLSKLGEKLSFWELALWFTTPHPDLANWRRPVDLLERNPKAVAQAAASTASEIVY